MGLVLPAVEGALAELTFDEARMRSALSSTMMATDLADYLVKKGSSFRQAHEAVGSLIQEAERRGCELGALGLETFTTASSLFGPDIFESLDPATSIAGRDIPGGTGPNAVRQQLDAARNALKVLVV
jgi:argininosuccinate lyase